MYPPARVHFWRHCSGDIPEDWPSQRDLSRRVTKGTPLNEEAGAVLPGQCPVTEKCM
jgi:hypothetical protein